MNEELQAARAKLAGLEAELAQLDADIPQVEATLAAMEARKRELTDGFHRHGEISEARGRLSTIELQIQDEALPEFDRNYWGPRLIVGVTDKWISLRRKGGSGAVRRYKRDTGWLERTRSGYDSIDVERALSLWAKHQAAIGAASLKGGATAHAEGTGDMEMAGKVDSAITDDCGATV
jgi:hypothetical protein